MGLRDPEREPITNISNWMRKAEEDAIPWCQAKVWSAKNSRGLNDENEIWGSSGRLALPSGTGAGPRLIYHSEKPDLMFSILNRGDTHAQTLAANGRVDCLSWTLSYISCAQLIIFQSCYLPACYVGNGWLNWLDRNCVISYQIGGWPSYLFFIVCRMGRYHHFSWKS